MARQATLSAGWTRQGFGPLSTCPVACSHTSTDLGSYRRGEYRRGSGLHSDGPTHHKLQCLLEPLRNLQLPRVSGPLEQQAAFPLHPGPLGHSELRMAADAVETLGGSPRTGLSRPVSQGRSRSRAQG